MNKSQSIQDNQLVSQGQGNIVTDMDGEKVMLNINKGKYYNLGDLGGEIWDLIKEPISFQEIVEALISKYDVDQSVCEDQVDKFLSQLNEENLIVLK